MSHQGNQLQGIDTFWADVPSANTRAHYSHDERPMQVIRKIVVKGSVDVYFRRFHTPRLVVAGETEEAVKSVKTYFQGGELIIESTSSSLGVFGAGNVVCHGSVRISVGGVFINGQRVQSGTNTSTGRVVVGVALPEIPAVTIQGSGDVTLLDLKQTGLALEIQGSGYIDASGQVEHLEISIAGSGDVDASELHANQAHLQIAGSGDIRAFVRQKVSASIAGSGGIVVRGDPPVRDKRVAGSGSVKFK